PDGRPETPERSDGFARGGLRRIDQLMGDDPQKRLFGYERARAADRVRQPERGRLTDQAIGVVRGEAPPEFGKRLVERAFRVRNRLIAAVRDEDDPPDAGAERLLDGAVDERLGHDPAGVPR